MYAFSYNVLKNKNLHINSANIFAYVNLDLYVVFIWKCLSKAVRDDISAKNCSYLIASHCKDNEIYLIKTAAKSVNH